MKKFLKNIFGNKKENRVSFQEKFKKFQEILADNDEAHKAMSELADMIVYGTPFSRGYAHKRLNILLNKTERMINNLIFLSGGRYRLLHDRLRIITEKCYKALTPRITCPEDLMCPDMDCQYCTRIEDLFTQIPYTYNLKSIREENFLEVGHKMARLGEIKNKLKIPVPDGFCISVRFFEDIMRIENLRNRKNEIFYDVDFNNIAEVQYASRQAQALIITTQLPDYLEKIIMNAFDETFDDVSTFVAVRSSAVGEDSEKHSFAGLHQSFLNISRENVFDAVIDVMLSKYSPQSVIYRYLSGLRDEDMPMAAGCIKMVDAKSAGVLFTKDPNDLVEGAIIQSVWGLGSLVVEGKVQPQQYIVQRQNGELKVDFNPGNQNLLRKAISKDTAFKSSNLENINLSEPNLTQDELKKLMNYARMIEIRYQHPQDIEWAVDKNGDIFILQSRNLKIRQRLTLNTKKTYPVNDYDKSYKVLINHGDCASHGVGSGKVFVVNAPKEVSQIPYGSVVVAKKNLPEFITALHKMSALISDLGSTTGHLAIIARELNVPFITNVRDASAKLQNGTEVTVIADDIRVYEGIIQDIVQDKKSKIDLENPFIKSPIYKIWHNLTRNIFKLNLYDPSSEKFSPLHCETIHDIIRFIHEIAMRTIFSIYDNTTIDSGKTYELVFDVPLDILVIDLGNGLRKDIKGNKITPEDIISKPMQYLIKGMTTPGLKWSGHLPVDTKGFAGIILGNIVDPDRSDVSLGSRSYALISENYINFFSRLGYHFSRLDAFASSETNSNYINFNFRGGASNITRKSRRAHAIARILEQKSFSVTINEDNVIARIRKIPVEMIYELLTSIGKLMGAVRNVDVLMVSDKHVDVFVEEFLKGNPQPGLKIREI